ncbi:hypothetical protein [Alteromonas sp. 14N.309.X.WAT.G.H12]|uniref:hypothetical protein n=1 Tax=Alteromonas sp. 14N.309.X.WAT.G.H12 TaxID=3120824 RepID=UPI002FD56A48
MNTFKLTCVAAFICGVVSGNVFAASKNDNLSEQEEKEKQASLNIDGVNTVATPELIKRSDAEGLIRDRLRTEKDIDGMRIDDADNKTILAKKERELLITKFINENVPIHVIAMGENAINAYLMEHFLLPETGDSGSEPMVVWESSSNVLSVPATPPDAWTPEVVTIKKPVVEAPKPDNTIEEVKEVKDKAFKVTDEDQKKALAIFGMNQGDLDALFDGSVKAEKKAKADINSNDINVLISDIEIKHLIIIGDTKYIDTKLTFDVLRNGQSRKIIVNKSGLKPGAIFSVEKERFELVSIDENQVVFENIDKRQTFTSPVG